MDELARLIPQKKDTFGYSFLTDQGIEAFAFDYSKPRFADDSKPLSLLAHVGEQPALVVAERNKGNLEQFAFVQKWSRIAFDYAIRFIPQVGKASEEARLFLEQAPQLRGFADALSRTTEEKLYSRRARRRECVGNRFFGTAPTMASAAAQIIPAVTRSKLGRRVKGRRHEPTKTGRNRILQDG